jgi:hypothetical protein
MWRLFSVAIIMYGRWVTIDPPTLATKFRGVMPSTISPTPARPRRAS